MSSGGSRVEEKHEPGRRYRRLAFRRVHHDGSVEAFARIARFISLALGPRNEGSDRLSNTWRGQNGSRIHRITGRLSDVDSEIAPGARCDAGAESERSVSGSGCGSTVGEESVVLVHDDDAASLRGRTPCRTERSLSVAGRSCGTDSAAQGCRCLRSRLVSETASSSLPSAMSRKVSKPAAVSIVTFVEDVHLRSARSPHESDGRR